MPRQGTGLTIDTSQCQSLIRFMQSVMTQKKFANAMYGIFSREASHVKTILGQDIPLSYDVKPKEVKNTVGKPVVNSNRGGMPGCIIPVSGKRRGIGSKYTATGSKRGWASVYSGHYNVTASILKSGKSTLPYDIDGYAPFRNVPSKLNKQAFYRTGKARLPILPVMGISIPQMPLNRSAQDVEDDIANHFQMRVAQRLWAFLIYGR